MGEVLEFDKSKKNTIRNKTILSSIREWILNYFHVHSWIDMEQVILNDRDGVSRIGTLFVQQCTGCKLRCDQIVDVKGVSERVKR